MLRNPVRGRKWKRVVGVTLVAAVVGWFVVPPLWVRYEIRQARSALAARDAERALVHLQRAQWLDSESAKVEFLLARATRRLGRFNIVRDHIQRAWDLGYPVESLKREQWMAQAQAGQLREAELHLHEMLADPRGDAVEICEAFANGYLITHRVKKALELVDAWQADYPEEAQPRYVRAMFYERVGLDAQAAEEYRAAFELAPQRSDIRLRLAQTLILLSKYDEAAEHFRALKQLRPDDVEIQTGWGECLLGQGQTEQARAIFLPLIEQHPDHLRARVALGRTELESGQPAKAVAWLKPVVEQQPNRYVTRYLYATALRSLGDTEAAQSHFEFADQARTALRRADELLDQVRVQPENLQLRYEIGKILLQYDDPSAGAGWLRSVVDLDPDHRAAHAALADYYTREGPPHLAERHRKRAQELERPDTGT